MKDELKRDPILQKIIEAVEYIKENKQYFIQGVVVLTIVITSIGYFNSTAKANEELATSIAGKAQNSYIDNQSENSIDIFKSILENYKDTKAADHALVLILQDAIRNDDELLINDLLNDFANNTNDPLLESSTLQAKAMIAVNLGEYENAKNLYAKASNISPTLEQSTSNTISSIRCLLKLEEFSDAKSELEELLDDESISLANKNIIEELNAEVQYYLVD